MKRVVWHSGKRSTIYPEGPSEHLPVDQGPSVVFGGSFLDRFHVLTVQSRPDPGAEGSAGVVWDSCTEDVKTRVKDHLRKKFTYIQEGTSEGRSRLKDVYTKLYITHHAEKYGSKSHEILDRFEPPDEMSAMHHQQIDCLNIFKPGTNVFQPTRKKVLKCVMTKGIAGIGKTVAVQNFALNWANERSNQHIDFIFVLPFRELNMVKEGEYSLQEILFIFHPELKLLKDTQKLNDMTLLFIFDGLDESRLTLDFDGSTRVTDIHQKSTVEVLVSNLIKKNLLPNALLWITTRPAAAGQIPLNYIDQMTEMLGFTEIQKEEFFRRRFSHHHAIEVLSRLRGMMSFHFMGHIPIFCWIIAEVFKEGGNRQITTMTELYTYYLLIQTHRTRRRSERRSRRRMSESQDAPILFNLSKLAFEQLHKGNIIFYEDDLRECDIDVDQASLFCGFCSVILKEELGLYQQKMFSFVHLSFQEFLAALYIFHCCVTNNTDTLKSFLDVDPTSLGLHELQKKVVNTSLHSEQGQLDLFVLFFLGFSLESNQILLQSVLPQIKSSGQTAEEMTKYLRGLNAGNVPPERCMVLFLCKYELKEVRFQEDLSLLLQSGMRLSPMDCSVLSTILQLSGETIDELDLTKCIIHPLGVEKLLLLMRRCKRALLRSEHLGHVRLLRSFLYSADLRELCLLCFANSNTPIPHALIDALGHSDCKVETLRLYGFSLDPELCDTLAMVLLSRHSSLRVLDMANCTQSYPQVYRRRFLRELRNTQGRDNETNQLTVIPAALIEPTSKLKKLSMPACGLKSKSCQVFAEVLSSNSGLRELDLSRNDLQDLGVQLLSDGLGSSKCRLEILSLSLCGVTKDGCASLASALRSNPSHLRELDLSYNHPGEAGVQLLSERLENPHCRLEKLSVDHDEVHWVNPQFLHNYACDLTFDPNTVNEHLLLSESDTKVTHSVVNQSYPKHAERFAKQSQVMCSEGLTGRCYWEVEWKGIADIGVVYKSIERNCHDGIDRSDKAWSFSMPVWNGYTFRHEQWETFVPAFIKDLEAFLARPKRLGLFLDWPAGSLSFYWLCGDSKTLLHTFHTTFTEPLYPAVTVYFGTTLSLPGVVKPNMDGAQSSFTPEVIIEKIGISYGFLFPRSGLFHCSLTGLVFNVRHEGEVMYRTVIWDEKLLQSVHKVPGGPLYSIKCLEGMICQLHLPHCEPEPALVSESLSVVHVTVDGMSIMQPVEITDTHVVVDISHLSAFGIVWDLFKRFTFFMSKPIIGQVLLFRRRYGAEKCILSVLLLPSNVPLQEVKEHHVASEYIQAPANCCLFKGEYYSLHSDLDLKIQPQRALFFENFGPNYHASFEIVLTTSTDEVNLTVQDPERKPVWEYALHVPALFSEVCFEEKQIRLGESVSAEKNLDRVRTHFIQRVSDPVLNELLDELLQQGVISDSESEVARVKPRADKARDVIDIVRKKGAKASSKMITILSKKDPYLHKQLNLG